MADHERFLIVGAGLAGVTAAETLRAEGFQDEILLLGAEVADPYDRPPLSKRVLQGVDPPERAVLHDRAFYAANGIELRLGTRVRSLDPARRTVETEDGRRLRYDRLLLAPGSRPRPLRVPGSDLGGILSLREVGDAVAIRDTVGPGSRVAVVGAGWIGSEVAASLRQRGADVTLVDPGPTPLHGALGREIGTMFADLHARHGIRLRMGTTVDRFVGTGVVEGVLTRAGELLPVDAVVVGVGAIPRLDLAEDAGLDVADGILVDEQLRTSAPGVWAAGDVASAWHPGLRRRLRVEHWDNARRQGALAATNMLGGAVAYDRLPYFFSDQYDVGIEFYGFVSEGASIHVRGDVDSRRFLAFWTSDAGVDAVLAVNTWDVMATAEALVASHAPVPVEVLVDEDVDLDRYLGEAVASR